MLHEEVQETEGGDERTDDAVGGRQREDQQHPARDLKRQTMITNQYSSQILFEAPTKIRLW
jgi:hypothetical protein